MKRDTRQSKNLWLIDRVFSHKVFSSFVEAKALMTLKVAEWVEMKATRKRAGKKTRKRLKEITFVMKSFSVLEIEVMNLLRRSRSLLTFFFAKFSVCSDGTMNDERRHIDSDMSEECENVHISERCQFTLSSSRVFESWLKSLMQFWLHLRVMQVQNFLPVFLWRWILSLHLLADESGCFFHSSLETTTEFHRKRV